ncbi:hypothetical protein AB4Y36_01515 [Paraburkholderia sp. BR10936]|uniref:hypothetical protein n=1 Tax=Paraburkholderia sp. BR10936 TaxID=3236993 RepID=UPI0034D3776E
MSDGFRTAWGPVLTAEDVDRRRAELISIIEDLASMERWQSELRDYTLAMARRCPLPDLLPNLAAFREVHAEVAARAAVDQDKQRLQGFEDRGPK